MAHAKLSILVKIDRHQLLLLGPHWLNQTKLNLKAVLRKAVKLFDIDLGLVFLVAYYLVDLMHLKLSWL